MLGLYLHSMNEHVSIHALADHVAIVRAIEQRDAGTAEEAGRRPAGRHGDRGAESLIE
jgi:hypothetical protein